MTVSFPDTFTIDTSEKYILSIRLSPDGLSFSGNIPMEENSFFFRKISFDRSKPYISSLKEFFFEQECFSWVYKKVNILCFTSQYSLVPEVFYDENKKKELLSTTFLNPEEKILDNILLYEQGRIVFSINQEVYGFLCRSFINAEFIHHLAPVLNLWKKQNQASLSGQMYVLLNRRTIDVSCYNKGELIFLNSFEYSSPDDIFYFLACVWTQTGLNQLEDTVFVFGNQDHHKSIMDNLRVYVQNVEIMDFPPGFHLLSNEAAQASYDLISLSICES